MILGNRQTKDGKIVTGNVTCNVYGGSWGTMYLGGRNNTTAVTGASTVGDVTLNLYGGSIGSVRKGYQDGRGCYVDGDVVVNIHTNAPENEAIVCDPLVLRGTVDGVVNTFATDEEHPNTPYAVNVIAGDKTLYFARDVYMQAGGAATQLNGTAISAMVGANLTADTIEGTLKIAPAANYFYAITCFGDEGYHASTDPTDVGRVGVGVAEVSFEWEDGVHLTLKGQTDSDLVIATNGAYSTISYVQDGENATWVAVDERPNAPYGTTIILDAKFNVRVLFEKAKVDSVGIDNYQVSYKLNGGEATGVDLVEGTGVYADYYYFIVDDGIDATGFNSVKIAVIVEAGDLNARTTTLTGESILNDLRALGGDNVTLADAISEYSNALNAFVDEKEIPAGEVTDVTDKQIDAYLTGATTNKITLAEGVTAYGISLTVTATLELNFYLKAEGTEITSAAVGERDLDNGLTLTTKDEYTVISMICGADELVSIHTLTVNGSETGFSASPLSYAKALKASDANLAQAIINYAYYVDQFAVKTV